MPNGTVQNISIICVHICLMSNRQGVGEIRFRVSNRDTAENPNISQGLSNRAVENISTGSIQIDPLYTAGDGADDLVVDCLNPSGIIIHGNGFVALLSEDNDFTINLHLGNMAHIQHCLIHAEPANDGGFFTTDQHMTIGRK